MKEKTSNFLFKKTLIYRFALSQRNRVSQNLQSFGMVGFFLRFPAIVKGKSDFQTESKVRLKNEKSSSQTFSSLPNTKLSLKVKLQYLLGHLAFFPIGLGIYFFCLVLLRYKIDNIKELRSAFKKILKEKKPLIICANHLTLIDSIVIEMALANFWYYLVNFKRLAWNLPAKENFANNPFKKILTWLCKCLYLDRKGSAEHINSVLSTAMALIDNGHPLMIFPEGERSRNGQIDVENVKYGIGRIVNNFDNCNVMCIYLRGENQEFYSDLPVKREYFYIDYQLYRSNPQNNHLKGLRADRQVSIEIINVLKKLEIKYFALKKKK